MKATIVIGVIYTAVIVIGGTALCLIVALGQHW